MYWTQTKPATQLVPTDDVKSLLAVTFDDDDTLIDQLIAAATAYAEKRMGRALVQRTVTATYYGSAHPPDLLYLPRVPVVSVTSVTPAGGAALTANQDYFLEHVGTQARLRINGCHHYPKDLTVVYEAGYPFAGSGNPFSTFPDDILQAVRMHAVYLYENRSGDGTPPAHLCAFYDLNSCETGVG